MNEPVQIDWESLLSVDKAWVQSRLCEHPDHQSHKLTIRVYSLRFSGTQQRLDEFADFLASQITRFCFTEDQIEQFATAQKVPWREAMRFFGGGVDPDRDGKLGELLLFLFVEGVLGAPLIAHKIAFLTNPNDQTKGSDGVFVGPYAGQIALLLGESKVWQDLDGALADALQSLSRFHGDTTAFQYELSIAAQMRRSDLTPEQLDLIYNKLLIAGTAEHEQCLLVHPVLLVHSESGISGLCQAAASAAEGEELMKALCAGKATSFHETVCAQLDLRPNLKEVSLDVFVMPVPCARQLRRCFYRQLHGVDYPAGAAS